MLEAAEALLWLKRATSLPWEGVIPLTALSMRVLTLPLVAKQQQASATLAWSLSLHRKHRLRALSTAHSAPSSFPRAASPTWLLTAPAAQIPLFLLTTHSVRTAVFSMPHTHWLTLPALSLSEHELLTAPLSLHGAILPALVVTAHLSGVSLAFRRRAGSLSLASTLQRTVLEWMSLPALLASLSLPHAVPLYWFSNAFLSTAQSAALTHPRVRHTLLPALPDLALMNEAAKFRQRGDLSSAEKYLRRAVSSSPSDSMSRFALGSTLSKQGNHADAADFFEASAERERDSARLRRALLAAGSERKRNGRLSDALALFERAQKCEVEGASERVDKEFIEPTRRDMLRSGERTRKEMKKRKQKRQVRSNGVEAP